MTDQTDVIEGMKAITRFMNRSETTVLKIIRSEDLETRRIIWKRGGIWVAHRYRLNKWWNDGADRW